MTIYNYTKIQTGGQPNDGTGDNIRDAFIKVNNSLDLLFTLGSSNVILSDVYTKLAAATGAGNVLSLSVSTAAPSNPSVGMFAVADRTTWDPASKGSGNAYPVFYDGSTWKALY
jgi:hypothetical protein